MVNMAGLYRNEKLGEGKPMSWRSRGQVEKSQEASMDSTTGICNAERAWSFFWTWQSLGEAAWVACRLRAELACEEGDELKPQFN